MKKIQFVREQRRPRYSTCTGSLKIDMDENTIVLLDFLDSSKKGRVRLGNGSVRFRQADPGDPKILNLEVVDKGQSFTLSGAGELLLNRGKPNAKLRVAALNDKVKLTGAGGIEETLRPDSLLVLSEKGVSKQRLSVVPQKPEDGAYIAGPGQSIALKFSWKTAVKKAQKVQIEISQHSNFSRPVLRKKIARSAFAARLKPGLYYWRLLGPPSKAFPGRYSVTRKFRVLSQAAVKTYKPLPKAVFIYRDIEPFVSFSWSKDPDAAAYFLEVAKDAKFKESIIKQNTLSINYGSNLAEGTYYWRVTVKNALTGSSLKSRTKSFKILRRKEIKLRLGLNLAPRQVLDRKSLAKKGFTLSWKANPEVARTEVVIAEDPKFSKVFIKEKVSTNFYQMKAKFTKSAYHYKINSYNEQGELISSSPARSFQVQDVKIKLTGFRSIYPGNKASLHRRLVVENGIRFTWSKPVGVDVKFKFLLARDRAFGEILSKKETKQSARRDKSIKKNGRYFWKVAALDAEDGSTVSETKVHGFTVVQLPVIGISGIGRVRGRIISRGGGSVKVSTSKGVITTTMDKITSIQHEY